MASNSDIETMDLKNYDFEFDFDNKTSNSPDMYNNCNNDNDFLRCSVPNCENKAWWDEYGYIYQTCSNHFAVNNIRKCCLPNCPNPCRYVPDICDSELLYNYQYCTYHILDLFPKFSDQDRAQSNTNEDEIEHIKRDTKDLTFLKKTITKKNNVKKRHRWTKLTTKLFYNMVEFERNNSEIKKCEIEKLFNVNRSTYWRWKKVHNISIEPNE